MTLFRRFAFAVAAAISCHSAHTATYYVDASSGNDLWTGKQQSPTATPPNDGPWQSLQKVSATIFQPGDSILLKCGQSWNETLRIASSGSATNPVSVGAYPAPCGTPPSIDGTTVIPSHVWNSFGNGIYRAPIPVDLLRNSSFSSNISDWSKWSANGDAMLDYEATCGSPTGACMSVTTGPSSSAIVSSNSFGLSGASQYTLGFSLKIPAGKTIRVVLRRSGPPWDAVGFVQSITGTGAWQAYSWPFRASATVAAARLDFEVPGGATKAWIDSAWVNAPNISKVHLLFASDKPVDLAHHPNRGVNPARPTSVYLTMAQNANTIASGSGYGSSYLATGSDLVLPAGAVLTPGISAFVRSTPWTLEEKTVSSVSGANLNFTSPTAAPLTKGFGYFLTGALWMLDSAGEWFHDSTSKTLYVRMPDSAAPGNRVSIATLDTGIDVTGRSYVTIDGLLVRRTGVGAILRNSVGIVLRNMTFRDIAAQGVDAQNARFSQIESNTFNRTGRDAIYAVGPIGTASNLRVANNNISESGVRIEAGAVGGLPAPSVAAIRPGMNAQVLGNRIIYSSYAGINPLAGSTVSDNYIEKTCLTLDDCGAIYTSGANQGTTISGNLVRNVASSVDGTPNTDPHNVGIYLDVLTSGVSVSQNTVINARFGIQLHNASHNRIEENVLYGNSAFQLFLQEHSATADPAGDVHDNLVLGNQMIPSATGVSISHDTVFASAARFGSYDRNIYSALFSPNIAREWWASGSFIYSLPTWQSATVSGVPRNLDASGRQVRQSGVTSFEVAGPNLISNGDFFNGIAGWITWYGVLSAESNCPSTMCLSFLATNAVTDVKLVSSPYFSVVAGQYYRVSFDLRTDTDGQTFGAEIRRSAGGVNGYDTMTGAPEPLVGTTNWQRHQFVFKSLKSVNKSDPVTLDNGARLDFERVKPGQKIYIDNVEIVPLRPVGTPIKTNILVNDGRTARNMDCPDTLTNPSACSMYVRFPDATPISWPHLVSGLAAEIIYTVDRTSLDADSDGIPDTQDQCPGTSSGAHTNSKGCALGQ